MLLTISVEEGIRKASVSTEITENAMDNLDYLLESTILPLLETLRENHFEVVTIPGKTEWRRK